MRFELYEDPKAAMRVWKEYRSDISSYGGDSEAEVIAGECQNSIELDVRLDELLTQLKLNTSGTRRKAKFHEDVDGAGSYYDVARKHLED